MALVDRAQRASTRFLTLKIRGKGGNTGNKGWKQVGGVFILMKDRLDVNKLSGKYV
jgi:hypothetical protein